LPIIRGSRVLTQDDQPNRCDRAVSYRVARDSRFLALSRTLRAGAAASTASPARIS